MSLPPLMTRCECANLAFEAIADVAEREGIDCFAMICKRTDVAATCTACKPDLQAFLDARRRNEHDGHLQTTA